MRRPWSPSRRAGPVPRRTTWKPLLSGALRERARDAAREIADALARVSCFEEPGPRAAGVQASLGGGAAGLAVAFSYLAAADVTPGAAERASAFLDSAIATVGSEVMPPDLCGGFAGVGWAASHLWSAQGEAVDDDRLSEVDGEVLSALTREPWDRHFDLLYGLVGLGVYALERLPRRAARSILARVVERLARMAESEGGLTAWRTPPHLLPPDERPAFPSGLYDLGVAHGIAGVVGLLAQACAAGVAVEKARPLLEGAVTWLLEQRIQGRPEFPYRVAPGGERSEATRSAWCYGDLGISAVLSLASRCAGQPAWQTEALSVASRSARIAPDDSGVVDASFCHGAAGVAHIFNRLYQRTGRGELREAATIWFERTLAMRGEEGIGGYTFARRESAGSPLRSTADASLVDGSTGVGLALAAAATAVEPTWDRFFLLSSVVER